MVHIGSTELQAGNCTWLLKRSHCACSDIFSRCTLCSWTLPGPIDHDGNADFAEVPTTQLLSALGQNGPSISCEIPHTEGFHECRRHLGGVLEDGRPQVVGFLVHPIPAVPPGLTVLRNGGRRICCTEGTIKHLLDDKARGVPDTPTGHDCLRADFCTIYKQSFF